MPILTKAQLEALNQASFPDQSTEAITPAILRTYNTATIDTLVDSLDTGSFVQDLTSLNAFTASQQGINTALNASTASQQVSINALNSFTASQQTINSGYNAFTSSTDAKFATIGTQSGSWGGGGSVVGYATTGSNTFTGSQTINGGNKLFIQRSATGANQLLRLGSTDNENNFAFIVTGSDQNPGQQVWGINIGGGLWANSFDAGVVFNSYVTASNGIRIQDAGTLSAPLQEGYVWVGDSTGRNTTAPTSSFGGGGTIPTGTVSSSAQILNYNIFATTGSNLFRGEQQITSSLNGITMLGYSNRLNFGNTSFNDRAWLNLAEGDGGNNGTALQFTGVNTGISFITNDSATPSSGVTSTRFENTSRSGSIQFANSGNAGLIQFTNATGSVSITTPGEITLQGAVRIAQKGGGNSVTVVNSTGSLLYTAGAYTTASLHLSQSSATSTTSVNFVFKTNNNTPDTIISGSNNIFVNPAAPTAGFKRYVGSNGNTILNANSTPQVSASMAFSPTMNNNIWGSAGVIMRGPVSSSTWTISNNSGNSTQHSIGTATGSDASQVISGLTLSNNFGGGFASITGWKTPLSSSVIYSNNLNASAPVALNCDSSSIAYTGNISSGQTTINNSYLPGTITNASGLIGVNNNTIIGTTIINASGSNTTFTGAPRGVNSNVIGGYSTIGLVLNGDSSSLQSSVVVGGGLVVTGSNSRVAGATANNDFGSAFFGRWNDVNGNKDLSAETVFAVGTGTSTTRKTGFLIDSGSNTFVEGTLNVSGSTSVTGSFRALIPTASNESTIDLFRLPTFVSSNGTTYNQAGFGLLDYASSAIDQTFGIEYANSSFEKYSALYVGPSRTQFIVGTGTGFDYDVIELLDNNNNTTTAKVKADTVILQGAIQATGSISIAPTFQAKFATGSNQQAGTAVLDGGNPGTVTVSNSLVTANSIIMLTKQTNNHPNSGPVNVSSKGAGTFTITSNHNGDGDTVGWFIINNS